MNPVPPPDNQPALWRRPGVQIGALGLACLGTYLGLRSLPVAECEFLHYGDRIDDEGVLEACGTEETSFFDLSQLRYPIRFDLRSEAPLMPGQAGILDFSLTTSTGRTLEWDQFALSHTRRLHLLVVDSSLDDYQHLHPEPEPGGDPRHFRVAFTPRRSGTYRVYLDCIPLLTNRRTLLGATLAVDAEGPATAAPPPRAERLTCLRGPLDARIALSPRLRAGEESELQLSVTAPGGEALRFEPVMGAFAHLVLFDPEGRGFAHLHPRNPRIEEQDPRSPDLRFVFSPDRPGYYRLWAQVQISGVEQFLDFWLCVE